MSTEAEFLANYDAGDFERPSVAVDLALLSVFDDAVHAVLYQRDRHPAAGRWALPGTFVGIQESLDATATRILRERAKIEGVYLEQLYSFGGLGRDPRTRVITVAYYALVDRARCPDLGFHRLDIPWPGETGGPVDALDAQGAPLPLAFDHADILGMAIKRIRGKLDYTPIGFQLLPERFTLRALQTVHETILARPLNKDSFRRRMLASAQLEATGEREDSARHRPAELYRFARRSAV